MSLHAYHSLMVNDHFLQFGVALDLPRDIYLLS